MQGVLAQAKNGDELWEDKFHAANGKPQACHQSALLFFLLSFGGGEEARERVKDFFSFFPGSQCVLITVPLSFQWVPNMLPNFPMCSPTCSP